MKTGSDRVELTLSYRLHVGGIYTVPGLGEVDRKTMVEHFTRLILERQPAVVVIEIYGTKHKISDRTVEDIRRGILTAADICI